MRFARPARLTSAENRRKGNWVRLVVWPFDSHISVSPRRPRACFDLVAQRCSPTHPPSLASAPTVSASRPCLPPQCSHRCPADISRWQALPPNPHSLVDLLRRTPAPLPEATGPFPARDNRVIGAVVVRLCVVALVH